LKRLSAKIVLSSGQFRNLMLIWLEINILNLGVTFVNLCHTDQLFEISSLDTNFQPLRKFLHRSIKVVECGVPTRSVFLTVIVPFNRIANKEFHSLVQIVEAMLDLGEEVWFSWMIL
jgi:hypothetical protein